MDDQSDTITTDQMMDNRKLAFCPCCQGPGYRRFKINDILLRPSTYERMYDRGWDRNGSCFLKPWPGHTCCENWQIRLDATKFKPKPKQLRIVKKMVQKVTEPHEVDELLTQIQLEQYKSNFQYEIMEEISLEDGMDQLIKTNEKASQPQNQAKKQKKQQKQVMEDTVPEQKVFQFNKFGLVFQEQLFKRREQINKACFNMLTGEGLILQEVPLHKIRYFTPKNKKGNFYNNYGMLLFSMNKKLFKKGVKLQEFIKKIDPIVNQFNGKISQQYKLEFEHSGYLVFKRHQEVLEDKQPKKNQRKERKIKPQTDQHPTERQERPSYLKMEWDSIKIGELTISIMPAGFCEQDFGVYCRYQSAVHQSSYESKNGYDRFLCANNLTSQTDQTDKPCQQTFTPFWDPSVKLKVEGTRYKTMGCFHMKYYLRDRLIGIDVVDLLPSTLVSNYFLYEPILRKYNFGVFSALMGIEYVRWLQLSFPEFRYQSLQYYMQQNKKLSYKSQYEPMEILCPATYRWIPFNDEIFKRIEQLLKKEGGQFRLSDQQPIEDIKFPHDLSQLVKQLLKPPHFNESEVSEPVIISFQKVFTIFQGYIKNFGKELLNILKFRIDEQLLQAYLIDKRRIQEAKINSMKCQEEPQKEQPSIEK